MKVAGMTRLCILVTVWLWHTSLGKTICFKYGVVRDIGEYHRETKQAYDYNADLHIPVAGATSVTNSMVRVGDMKDTHLDDFDPPILHDQYMYKLTYGELSKADELCSDLGEKFQLIGIEDQDSFDFVLKLMELKTITKLPVALEKRPTGLFNIHGGTYFNRGLADKTAEQFNSRYPFMYFNDSVLPSLASDDNLETDILCRQRVSPVEATKATHYSLSDFIDNLTKKYNQVKPLIDGVKQLHSQIPKIPYNSGNELVLRPTKSMATVIEGLRVLGHESGWLAKANPRWIQDMASAVQKAFAKTSSFLETDLTPAQVNSVKASLGLTQTIVKSAAKFIPKKKSTGNNEKYQGSLVLTTVPRSENYMISQIDALVLPEGKILSHPYMVTSSKMQFVADDLEKFFGGCAMQPLTQGKVQDYTVQTCKTNVAVAPTIKQMACAKALNSNIIDENCDWKAADYVVARRANCGHGNAVISSPKEVTASVVCGGRTVDSLVIPKGFNTITSSCSLVVDDYVILNEIRNDTSQVPPSPIFIDEMTDTELILYVSVGGVSGLMMTLVSCMIYCICRSKKALKAAKSTTSINTETQSQEMTTLLRRLNNKLPSPRFSRKSMEGLDTQNGADSTVVSSFPDQNVA